MGRNAFGVFGIFPNIATEVMVGMNPEVGGVCQSAVLVPFGSENAPATDFFKANAKPANPGEQVYNRKPEEPSAE